MNAGRQAGLLSDLKFNDNRYIRRTDFSVGQIPIYGTHTSAPTPDTGLVSSYFIDGDYDYLYLKYPDGTNKGRRIALSWIDF